MRRILILFCYSFFVVVSQCAAQVSLHQFTVTGIDGNVIDLASYQGKKLLLVNTASYCQYTPQYAQLESLYKQYKNQGFEILGFPCNDFGSQEPGKDSVIDNFCSVNYSVTFQMMSKVQIAAGDTTPLYKWLQKKALNGVADATVDWNFNKFLIDECGFWVAHHASPVLPGSSAITNWISSAACSVTGTGKGLQKLLLNAPECPLSTHLKFAVPAALAGKIKVTLISSDGQRCSDLDAFVQENGEVSYDLSFLPQGLYVLVLTSGQETETLKLIISRD